MAEYIGAIIGIAAVAVDLSRKLYKIGGRVAGARRNINRVATNLVLFSSTLQHVASVLPASKEFQTEEAKHTVREIERQCNKLFTDIQDLATPGQDMWERAANAHAPNERKRRWDVAEKLKEKIRWSFEQPKVEMLLAHLEYLKSTLCILIQTLNLAMLSASLRKEKVAEKTSEEVVQSRLHIETLVYARHLSVVSVEELAEKEPVTQPSRCSSPEGSEATIEIQNPKLLQSEADVTKPQQTDIIRLGGAMDFLEEADHHDPTPGQHSVTLQHDVVDLLLQHWTLLHHLAAEPLSKEQNVDEDQDVFPVTDLSPTSLRSTSLPMVAEVASPPALTLEKASTLGSSPGQPAERLPTPPSPESTSWEHADASRRSSTARSSISSKIPNPYPTPPTQSPTSPVLPTPAPLQRSKSNPEDEMFDRLHFIPAEHHHLHPSHDPHDPPALDLKNGSQPAQDSYPGTHAGDDGPQAAELPSSSTPRPTNYRTPHISSDRDTLLSGMSDEEDFVDYPAAERAKARQMARDISKPAPIQEIALVEEDDGGLEIPWRIRLSHSLYFNFKDRKYDGPRRNVDNLESIFTHPEARTEISKEWVTERALFEGNLGFIEIAPDASTPSKAGTWRIQKALKFPEVERLVERTIELIKQHEENTRRSLGRRPSAQPPGAFILQPPPRLPHQPTDPGPAPIPISQPRQRRSASFSSSRPDLRPVYGPRSPNAPGGVFPPSSYTSVALNSWAQGAPSPRPRNSGEWIDNGRLREPSRDGPRREKRYTDDGYRGSRERDSSRSSRRSVRSTDKGRHRSAGEKVAKLGALAALLDGMDSLVL